MTLTNQSDRYGTIGMILHWGMAIMMVAAFILGQSMEDMPRGAEKLDMVALHLLVGGSVLLAVLGRIAWRRADPPPALPATMPDWERKLSKAAHLGLYGIMIAMPLTGLAAMMSSGRPFAVFDWFTLPAFESLTWAHEGLEEIHEAMIPLLVFSIVLHVAATAWHHFVRKDDVAKRMIPFLK